MMTSDQVEQEISRATPGAVTCASKEGNSVAVLKDGRWVTLAARGIDGRWYSVTMPRLCANGKEVFPQSLYMPV